MQGRHLISGILHALFGFLWFMSIKKENNTITVRNKFLGLFSASDFPVTFDCNDADVSFFTTQWEPFKTYHLIVNGGSHYVKQHIISELEVMLSERNILQAPLIYSLDTPKEPQYVAQIGKTELYKVGPGSPAVSWNYEDVSYNTADLGTKSWKYLLINTMPIAVPNESDAEPSETLLKSKGANKDPYLVSPVVIERKRFPYSLFSRQAKRFPYLLLGNKYCFREKRQMTMEDIVYFDSHDNGMVHFGTGVDFYYPKFTQHEITGIREYFISKGAELHADGQKFTTRITWRPSTWFKSRRQTVTLGRRGIFYTRRVKKMDKTSFIPYFDIYFINRIGWKFWGRKLDIFGSQNIETWHTFKNGDYKKILEKIYTFNPRLKKATGKKFRSFSWNPLKQKSYVVIGEGMLMHGHPLLKKKLALEGKHVLDAKKYGRFYHIFKDVVISTSPDNLRYDEKAETQNIGPFVEGTKIDYDDKWLKRATQPIFCTHLWCGTASSLMDEVSYVKGKESTFRSEYKESAQAKMDLKAKHKQMAEFAAKPSLVQFVAEIRAKTGCEVAPVQKIVDDSVVEDLCDDFDNQGYSSDEPEVINENVIVDDATSIISPSNDNVAETGVMSSGLKTLIQSSKFKKWLFAITTVALIAAIIGIIWLFTGSSESESAVSPQSEKLKPATTEGEATDNQNETEIDPMYEGGNAHPDYDPIDDSVITENSAILRKLYDGAVFGYGNPSAMSEQELNTFISRHMSDSVQKRLRELNDYDDGGLALWELRSGEQDGDGPSKVTYVDYIGDNWYKVTFLDMGHQGEKEFKIEEGKITDFK